MCMIWMILCTFLAVGMYEAYISLICVFEWYLCDLYVFTGLDAPSSAGSASITDVESVRFHLSL